ncbi:4782_t:CDS:2 [Dentiscutata heterogama]|uniref:4782_t:CDS:1 n=1 Tax=Dentiscutata heterogama TaxID=1316150 RepID=A0ACA9KXN0_9GLOM|nr:4782_t:CDS:2 [Dentiscutata heterogama]
MEFFLTSHTSISAINIFTALCKRVETGEWMDDKKEELKNFKETLNKAINSIKSVKDNERLKQLNDFREGDFLNQRDLGYNHPVCSEIIDDSLKPFMDMKEKFIKIFRMQSDEKFKLLANIALKNICEKFLYEEQENLDVEIGYLEMGHPKSSLDKQRRDYKKLNRFGKDSIDFIKESKHKRKTEKLSIEYLTIFTINIVRDTMEFCSMCKESGLYKVSLLD